MKTLANSNKIYEIKNSLNDIVNQTYASLNTVFGNPISEEYSKYCLDRTVRKKSFKLKMLGIGVSILFAACDFFGANDTTSYEDLKNPDVTAPNAPIVEPYDNSYASFNQINLELINQGDSLINEDVETVSGIESIVLKAMPIDSNFSVDEIITYGEDIGSYVDDAVISESLPRSGVEYTLFSITTDNAQNSILKNHGKFFTEGSSMELGHTYLGNVSGYDSGVVEVYGKLDDHEEFIGSFLPNATGQFNYNCNFASETLIFKYDSRELELSHAPGGYTFNLNL